MISALASVFISIASLSPTMNQIHLETNPSTYEDIPSISIQLGAFETHWYWSGFIGQHVMLDIKSYEYIGIQKVQQLTDFYNGAVLENFDFTSTFSSIETDSVSTTKRFSSEINTGLELKLGFPGAEIKGGLNISTIYEIEETQTYTTSTSSSISIDYSIKHELVENEIFALITAGHVYKIECETWKWDDYWWGDYEVAGSRESFYAYYVIDPMITIQYIDGNIFIS